MFYLYHGNRTIVFSVYRRQCRPALGSLWCNSTCFYLYSSTSQRIRNSSFGAVEEHHFRVTACCGQQVLAGALLEMPMWKFLHGEAMSGCASEGADALAPRIGWQSFATGQLVMEPLLVREQEIVDEIAQRIHRERTAHEFLPDVSVPLVV